MSGNFELTQMWQPCTSEFSFDKNYQKYSLVVTSVAIPLSAVTTEIYLISYHEFNAFGTNRNSSGYYS